MLSYPDAVKKLIEQFTTLPSIGPKSAERLVFYLLKQPKERLVAFASALAYLRDKMTICEQCHNISETSPCLLCRDQRRNQKLICVVAKTQDLLAIEKTSEFDGLYHVLDGLIDPLGGITPEQLTIKSLVSRIKKNQATEIILGLSSDLPGETTMLYLIKLLRQFQGIKITRLAQGLPLGSDLEYTDEVTLGSALKGRREV